MTLFFFTASVLVRVSQTYTPKITQIDKDLQTPDDNLRGVISRT